MKKTLIVLLVTLICFTGLFAEETVLLSSTASANLDGYDYVSNFEIESDSGYMTKSQLVINAPNERGWGARAFGVPKDGNVVYRIVPAYPSFLNEPNTGAGYIENAAAIKYIKIVGTLNRPYDDITLLYSTSPNGPIQKIKFNKDNNTVRSMEEFELIWENKSYIADAYKRTIEIKPVLGAETNGIYFRGIEITANATSGPCEYAQYSVFYLKEISVIYDNAFTPEQLEYKKTLKEEFGVSEYSGLIEKTRMEIAERNRLREEEESLMHSDEE